MKKTLRVLSFILIAVMAFSLIACDPKVEATEMKVGVLKGPTGVGAVSLIEKAEKGETEGEYKIDLFETANADALVTNVVNGSVDIAAVPINTAAALYNKTNGGVRVIAANALGVLSIIGSADVANITELKGAVIHTVNQGATPEYILRYVLAGNGINPDSDVELVFHAKPDEATVAMMSADDGKVHVTMIPEPATTAMLAKNKDKGLKLLFNMTEEWNKVSESKLVQGVLVARKEFVENNADAVALFVKEYAASVAAVNADPASAAPLAVKYIGLPSDAVATKAIPGCNVVCVTGEAMKKDVSDMLKVLFEANPKSVGGKLPADDLYYFVPDAGK